MFEVIISSIITGKVRRKVFDSREEANRHIDKFFSGRPGSEIQPPLPRNYRVEVFQRELPVVRPLPAVVAA